MYAALIANPSTGKSPAMNMIQNIILKIENHFGISPANSPITNVGSVEGLLEYLTDIPCMIGNVHISY
jgi:hypothetical protein